MIVQFINDSPRVTRGEKAVKVVMDFKLSEAVTKAKCKFGHRRVMDCKYMHVYMGLPLLYMLWIKLVLVY